MIRLLSFVFLASWLVSTGAQESPAEQISVAALADQLMTVRQAPVDGLDPVKLDRAEVRRVYQNYMQAEQFDEAIDAARVGLKLTVEEFGPDHLETVDYLNDLGNALLQTGAPGEARVAFEQSVAIVKNQMGVFHQELIEPLHGLGLALQRLAEHDLAISTLQYSQHVLHRAEGVNSLNQIRTVEAASRSMMQLHRWREAENLQLLVYKLYRRAYGSKDVDTVPGMYRLAHWYREVGDYRQARVILRQTLEIQEREYGPDVPEMIPGLRGIAAAYLEENGPDAIKGLRAQQKLVDILAAHPERFTLDDKILAHLEMGDWFVQFNDEKDAWEQYRRAWELAQEGEDSLRDWDAYFDRPHLIYPGATIALEAIGYGRAGEEVYYDFEFTIGADGRPQEISVLGTNLHGQTRVTAIQAFRYARFRPRIVDGQAVATAGYKVRRIYPTDAPEDYGQVSMGRRG